MNKINKLKGQNELLKMEIKCLRIDHENTRYALEQAIDELEKLEREQKWTPVSDGLPEEHEESQDIYDVDTLAAVDTKHFMTSDLVVVTVKDFDKDTTFVCDDITVHGKWVNFNNDSFQVIAWQNLPTPYKEAQND